MCGYEAFSSDGGDELSMQAGTGECLVCHYRRSPAIANALAREMEWERRGEHARPNAIGRAIASGKRALSHATSSKGTTRNCPSGSRSLGPSMR